MTERPDSPASQGSRHYTKSSTPTNKDKRQNTGNSGHAISRSPRQSGSGKKASSTTSVSTSKKKPSQPLVEITNVKAIKQVEPSSKKVARSSSRTHQTTGTLKDLATGNSQTKSTVDTGKSAVDIPKQSSSSLSMRKQSHSVANYTSRVKLKVTFPGLDGSPEQLMALTKRQTERWIKLLTDVHKKAPTPSIRASRMADSTRPAQNTNKDPSGLLRKVLPIYVVGDEMGLKIDIKVGNDIHKLLVDTGSAVTWLPTERYQSKNRKEVVAKENLKPISYIFMPKELPASLYKDDFVIDDVVIRDQEFAVVHVPTQDLHRAFREGVFGIANSRLSRGMIKNDSRSIVTPLDNMVKQRLIDAPCVVLDLFVWESKRMRMSGVLTLGEIDDLGKGAKYVDASQSWPACYYLGVDMSSSVASTDSQREHQLFENKTGIIDTGTTLILLEEKAFEEYIRKVGAKHYKSDWWYVTESDYDKMGELRFSFLNGVDYEPVEIVLERKEQVVEHRGIKIDGRDCSLLAISPFKIPDKSDDVWIPDFILGNIFLRSVRVFVDASEIYDNDGRVYGVKIGFEKRQHY